MKLCIIISTVKINRPTLISSNKIIILPKYLICCHSLHVIPLIETIPYSLFISCIITEFWMTFSLALNNWGQKYCQIVGYKPNPSIPIIFDRFSFKFQKITWLQGEIKIPSAVIFYYYYYPWVALTCSSLLISLSLHCWELCFFVAGFLRS